MVIWSFGRPKNGQVYDIIYLCRNMKQRSHRTHADKKSVQRCPPLTLCLLYNFNSVWSSLFKLLFFVLCLTFNVYLCVWHSMCISVFEQMLMNKDMPWPASVTLCCSNCLAYYCVKGLSRAPRYAIYRLPHTVPFDRLMPVVLVYARVGWLPSECAVPAGYVHIHSYAW